MDSYMFFYGMNVWFLYDIPNPGLVDCHAKYAMRSDGYWDNYDMTDEDLSDGIHYSVPKENMLKLEAAYKSLYGKCTSDGESWACCETMKAVAKEFHV